MNTMHLLPREALIVTGPLDHADWNFRPLLGRIQRKRFQLAVGLLPHVGAGRLLEIGYGSGVFMPELARRCGELHGVDIHHSEAAVTALLHARGIEAELRCASVERLPYGRGFFDQVIAISSLEFVHDLDASCREIVRVLSPGGRLVVVTPGASVVVDLGLKVLAGTSASADYDGRRGALMATLKRHFDIERCVDVPRLGDVFRLYRGMRLRPQA